jgi:hypothetical protein
MTFDNSKTIINLRIGFFIATIILLAYLALVYVARLIKFPFLGLSDAVCTLILVCIWFLLTFMPMFLSYQYVFFSDDGEKIIFRYFTAGFISGKKNSVEIDKKSFSGYKIETSFFGLIQKITLLQKFQEGVAKYPPIFISALSHEERLKVFKSLNLYSSPA